MTLTTLVTSEELVAHLDDPLWVVVDCRFDLQDAEKGRRDYLAAHIPGAVYAHLNNDLAGPPVPGQTGWHPLPNVPTFAQTLSRWGIDNAVQVAAYDDWGGALAARLWWMLRWVGHEAVAVLDGGWPLWQQAGYSTRSGEEMRPARSFVAFPREDLVITTDEVQQRQQDPSFRLLDTRPPEMYSGAATMADLPAGHIPGALSFPLSRNLGEDGRFLPPEELRAHYREVLAEASAEDSATYCVSGVTSTHNLLAMLHAGLGEGRLYVGSWSEWSSDPQRPTEQE
jgi:thiosulfate/3-mercaptopyruvate sulfurtransferase